MATWGVGFRVHASGFRAYDVGCWVYGVLVLQEGPERGCP